MIHVTVKMLALARDLSGTSETTLHLENGAAISQLFDSLARQYPKFNEWKNHLRFAVNYEYVEDTHVLHDNDEVAVIPPVSGG